MPLALGDSSIPGIAYYLFLDRYVETAPNLSRITSQTATSHRVASRRVASLGCCQRFSAVLCQSGTRVKFIDINPGNS